MLKGKKLVDYSSRYNEAHERLNVLENIQEAFNWVKRDKKRDMKHKVGELDRY